MSKLFSVTFNVMGWCEQTIELNDDCEIDEEELERHLNSGKILTSIQENNDVFMLSNGEMIKIGTVVSSIPNGDYTDFEVN